jgi:hypothetical protein
VAYEIGPHLSVLAPHYLLSPTAAKISRSMVNALRVGMREEVGGQQT